MGCMRSCAFFFVFPRGKKTNQSEEYAKKRLPETIIAIWKNPCIVLFIRKETLISKKLIKFSSTMSQSAVKEACVELETVDKKPFAVLNSKAFNTLTEQTFSGLNMPAVTD